ncbi:hypothetical protein SK128_023227 [Halocaridina rubra]|uniref:Uncharacterized protein n=1 Tax=Halocaridina rubra TaxID=373956 RepID=A0AAN8WB90_HALRR
MILGCRTHCEIEFLRAVADGSLEGVLGVSMELLGMGVCCVGISRPQSLAPKAVVSGTCKLECRVIRVCEAYIT